MSPEIRTPRTRVPLAGLALTALAATALAACSTAPAAPDLTPPPRGALDAKTQLEYGSAPPPPARY